MKGSSRALNAFGHQMRWYVFVDFCRIAYTQLQKTNKQTNNKMFLQMSFFIPI